MFIYYCTYIYNTPSSVNSHGMPSSVNSHGTPSSVNSQGPSQPR